jgi:hypothetical protein
VRLVDSPGQLEGGGVLVARVLPSGPYGRYVRASVGQVIVLSVRLADTSYGPVTSAIVKAPLPTSPEKCFTIHAEIEESPGVGPDSSPIYVRSTGGQVRLRLVPRSTKLYSDDRIVATLPNTIAMQGVELPYKILGGETMFVNFQVRVTKA